KLTARRRSPWTYRATSLSNQERPRVLAHSHRVATSIRTGSDGDLPPRTSVRCDGWRIGLTPEVGGRGSILIGADHFAGIAGRKRLVNAIGRRRAEGAERAEIGRDVGRPRQAPGPVGNDRVGRVGLPRLDRVLDEVDRPIAEGVVGTAGVVARLR